MSASPSKPAIIPWVWRLLSLAILLLLALIGYYFWQSQQSQRTDNAYVKADVVWLMAPLSGELISLKVQEQQPVEQGSVVAVIQDTEQTNHQDQLGALTALKSTALDIHQQTESAQLVLMEGLRAELRVAQQAFSQLNQNQQRQQILLKEGLVSSQSVELIRLQLDSAAARISMLNTRIQAAERQQQALLDRRAQLEQELQVTRQTAKALPERPRDVAVVAPITGQVSGLSAQLNSHVVQGSRLMALTAPESFYVEAWFDEPEVAKMQLGQPVDIRLDAYPEPILHGYIVQLRPDQPLPPLQNSRIRRLPVRIELLDPLRLQALRAGLAASVTVDLRSPIRYSIKKSTITTRQ